MGKNYVYLDLETTGVKPNRDEIVQIGILDDDNNILMDTLVRPIHNRSWPKAESIHGISPIDVKDAPALDELRPQIIEAVKGKDVVIYNSGFDSRFLPDELTHAASVEDCMEPFAAIYGERNRRYGGFKWQKLETAARYVSHQWTGQSHRAIHDCMATRSVWHYILKN